MWALANRVSRTPVVVRALAIRLLFVRLFDTFSVVLISAKIYRKLYTHISISLLWVPYQSEIAEEAFVSFQGLAQLDFVSYAIATLVSFMSNIASDPTFSVSGALPETRGECHSSTGLCFITVGYHWRICINQHARIHISRARAITPTSSSPWYSSAASVYGFPVKAIFRSGGSNPSQFRF